MTFKHWSFQ